MKNCVVLDDYQDVALKFADWHRLSNRVRIRSVNTHFTIQDELVAAIGDAEIVVIMRERTPFPATLIDRLPNLQLIVTTGMRNAAIDLQAARDRRIVVCGTGTGASPPMELTWALLLALARNMPQEHANLRNDGAWQSSVGMDLAEGKLGIIGLGKIGTQVAQIGKAFRMDVCAWSPNLTRDRAEAAGVRLAPSKRALLEESDFVTIHMVLSSDSRGLIGEADLRQMRREAYLINTSRAGLVDQEALVKALEENWIAGAGVDVYEQEPLPSNSPFRRLPNVLALPHLGYVSRANYRTFYGQALEDIEAWLSGSPMRLLS